MRKLLAIVLLAIAGGALGQSGNFPALVGQRGTTTPTNCTIGQLFFDTDATAGQNIYGCTAANTWTLMDGGASSGITVGAPVVGGGINRVLFEDASQLLATNSGFTFASNVLAAPTVTVTTKFNAPSNTVGTAAYAFTGSTVGISTTAGDDSALFAANSRSNFRIGSTYLATSSDSALQWYSGASVNPVFSFSADTGISRLAAGIVSFDTGTRANGLAALALSERTAPSAPAANGAYVYAVDNGAGKTQLCALFNSGAAQCFATEP